jgi:large-conductance mechanosensitive channel
VERLDRRTILAIAIALAVGFAVWQLAYAVGILVADILVEWWNEDETFGPFGASFSIGDFEIEYGQLLGATFGFLLVAALAAALLSRLTRRPSRDS